MVFELDGSARPQPAPSSTLRDPSPSPSPPQHHNIPRSFSLSVDAIRRSSGAGGWRLRNASLASIAFDSESISPGPLVRHTSLSSAFVLDEHLDLGNLVTNSPLLYADRRASMPMAGGNEPWVQPDQLSNRHSFVPPLPDIPAYYSSRNLARAPARNKPPRAGYLPRTGSLNSYDNRFPTPNLNPNRNITAPNGFYRAPSASNSYSTLPRNDSCKYGNRLPALNASSNRHASTSNGFYGQSTVPTSYSPLPQAESSVYNRGSPVPHSTSSRNISAPGKIRRKPVANSYATVSTLTTDDSQRPSTASASISSNDLSQLTDTSLRTSTPSRMSSTTYKDDQERYTQPGSLVFCRQSGNVAGKVRTFSEEFPFFDESTADFDATSTFHEFRNTRTDLDPLDPSYMEDDVSPGQIERPKDPVGTKAGQQPTKQARKMPSFFGKASTPVPSKPTTQGHTNSNKTLRSQSSRFNFKKATTKPTLKQGQRASDITDHIFDNDPSLKPAKSEANANLPAVSDAPNPSKTLKNKNKPSPRHSRSMFNLRQNTPTADLVIGDPFNSAHVAGFGTAFNRSTPINGQALTPTNGQRPVQHLSISVTATQLPTQASGPSLARSPTSTRANGKALTSQMTQHCSTTRTISQVSVPPLTNSSTPAQISGRTSGLRWGKRPSPAPAAPGQGAPRLTIVNTAQVSGSGTAFQNANERTGSTKPSTPTTGQAPRPRSKLPFQSRVSAKSSKGMPSKLSITLMDDAIHTAGTGTVFEDAKRQIAAEKQAALELALRESTPSNSQLRESDISRNSPRQYTSRQDDLRARHVMTPTRIPSPISERPDYPKTITPVRSSQKKENNPPAKEHRLLGQISPTRVQEQPTGLPLPKSKTLVSFSNFGRTMVNFTTRNQSTATLHGEPTTSVSEESATAVPVVPDNPATASQAISGNNFRMVYMALPRMGWASIFSSLNDKFQTDLMNNMLQDPTALGYYQSREESTRKRNRSDNPFSEHDEIEIRNVGLDNLDTEEHRRWKRVFIVLESRCIGDEAKESLWDFQEYWANRFKVPKLIPTRSKKEDDGFMSKFKNVFAKPA